jgi:uncharacterized protein (DUF2062 family)
VQLLHVERGGSKSGRLGKVKGGVSPAEPPAGRRFAVDRAGSTVLKRTLQTAAFFADDKSALHNDVLPSAFPGTKTLLLGKREYFFLLNPSANAKAFCLFHTMSADVSSPPSPPPVVPKASFWSRKVKEPIVAQLTQGVTPDKIALTVAVGSALALFPILGTTSLLCLIAGIFLRLNQPIIQVVNWACTPIHIPLIFYCVHLGEKLFGSPHTKFKLQEIAKLLWEDPLLFAQKFGLTGFHACVVWAIAAPFWVAIVYYSSRPIFRKMAKVRALAAVKLVVAKDADAKK